MFWRSKKRSEWKEHFNRGGSSMVAGDLKTAMEHFKKAIELAPEEPYPHYELGFALSLQGEFDEALKEFRRTNELCPGFFLVQTEILLCEGVLSGKIDEQTLDLLRQIQRLADSGGADSPDSVSLSEQVIKLAPACPLGHYYLGKALFSKDRKQSETLLNRCLELAPDDTTAIDALIHLGFHREEAGDLESARNIWRSIVSEYKGNPHAHMAEEILNQREEP